MSELPHSSTQSTTLDVDSRESEQNDGSPRKARVLFLGAYPPPTIASRAVSADIADRLASVGWTVMRSSSQRLRALRVLDVQTAPWRERKRYDVAHIDVFSGVAFRWAEGTSAVLRALGRPYVVTLHGGNLPAFAEQKPKRIQRLLAGAARVTAPSGYLIDALCAGRRDAVLLPNPIDLSLYPLTLRCRPQPRLIWLRAFHSIYDPRLAVEVVARLAPEFPSLALTMVGPDKDGSLARVQTQARELRVADRVHFLGPVPKAEVPRCLASADIFLNTTMIDNTPVSVLEAMASGLCVVSTDVGGIPHLLTDDHSALLVPPGDAAAMAAAVRRVLTEPGLAERLATNARHAAETHDWSRVLPRWESLFGEVAALSTPSNG